MTNGLTVSEQRTLEACEDDLLKGGELIVKSLKTIRDQRLFRNEFDSFEAYCEQKWNLTQRHVNRLIKHDDVLANIADMADSRDQIGPNRIKESATREIADLSPKQQREVISKVKASGQKPTAAAVKEARQEVAPKPGKPVSTRPPEPEENLSSADDEPVDPGLAVARTLKVVNDACKVADGWDPRMRSEMECVLKRWLDKWKPSPAGKFSPPTIHEVEEHIREKRYQVDAEAFVSFYASKGWKVGNQPMKDWKAALVTWSKKQTKVTGAVAVPPGKYDFIDNAQ